MRTTTPYLHHLTHSIHRATAVLVAGVVFTMPLVTFAEDVSLESVSSSSGNMIVDEPAPNASIGNPVIIRGEARVFENTVEFRIRSSAGTLLLQGFTTANAPDIGQFGDFQIYATYNPPDRATGTIEVFSTSAADGSEINKVIIPVTFSTFNQPPPPPPSTEPEPSVALYRMYNARVGDHFYTTNSFERDQAAARMGYVFEGTSGYVFATQVAGTVPLFRLYHAGTGDHFYTVNTAERQNAMTKFGYVAEGTVGFVRVTDNGVTTALFRLFNGRISDHFYTVNPNERNRAITVNGYTSEGVAGFVGAPRDNMLSTVYFTNTVFNPSQTNCRAVYAVSREVPRTVAVARTSIEQLLLGPTSGEISLGYRTSIPSNVRLQSINLFDSTIRVDFSEELNAVAGSCNVLAVRSQIEQTLLQFPSVKTVLITVNGRSDVLQP